MTKQSKQAKAAGRQESVRAVVAEFERSGLTRKRFSEESGVAVSTLDYWRRQVRQWNSESIVPVRIDPVTGGEPVDWGQSVSAANGFRLSLPNGVRIEGEWSFPESGLARLLRVAAGVR